jgi:hypothetical protein
MQAVDFLTHENSEARKTPSLLLVLAQDLVGIKKK